MTRSDNQTDHPVRRVTTYADMLEVATAFAKSATEGKRRFIALVYGRGGFGKSSIFIDGLHAAGLSRITLDDAQYVDAPADGDPPDDDPYDFDDGYHYFGSDISTFDMYTTLLIARDAPIIFDDTDCLLKTTDLRAKIKQLCDTRNPTVVTYNRASVKIKSFVTRSPVALLLNEAPTSNPHVLAILDRFNEIIHFDPDKSETLAYAKKMRIADDATIRLIRGLPIIPSLRTLVIFEANCDHYSKERAIQILLESHSDRMEKDSACRKIHPHAIIAMDVMETIPKADQIREFGKRIGKPIPKNGKMRESENYAAVQRALTRVRKDAESMLKAKRRAL